VGIFCPWGFGPRGLCPGAYVRGEGLLPYGASDLGLIIEGLYQGILP